MNKGVLEQISQELSRADHILLVSHVRPDGDAVSSILALGFALQEIGKNVQMVLADGVPTALRFLAGWEQVLKTAHGPFDLVVALDSADQERIGAVIDEETSIDINIDHHATNTNFGRLNLVIPDSVATCAILADIFSELELPITQPIAEILLTGILTDSQGFRTLNTNADALRISAGLVELGANISKLYDQALVHRSLEATRYWGAGLSRLQSENGIVWVSLSIEDRKAVGYRGRDDADLINVLSAIDGNRIAVIFIEQDAKTVKVSWRGQAGEDVSRIAVKFGGGGHTAAAGAMVEGSLEEVENKVIKATTNAFEKVEMV
jgi:phosphoesterase RecJ-like protein